LIYLPIAEMPVNVVIVLLVSAAIGFVSGLVGVGGGFIMTPSLIFLGVPAPVAVATGASQIAATSFSGMLAQTRRKAVDWRMGALLSIGGLIGGYFGVRLFRHLLQIGQLDLIISLLYLFLLAVVGGLMLWEGVAVMRGRAAGSGARFLRRSSRSVAHALPLRLRFPRSGLYISVLPPLAFGFAIGAVAAIMGLGGGFILIPAMIYLLRMPTNVVIGTSLFYVLIVSCQIVVLQAAQTQTVDLVLAGMLMLGGVIGAQLGVRLGAGLKSEHLRAILGAVLLLASVKFLLDVVVRPSEDYVLAEGAWAAPEEDAPFEIVGSNLPAAVAEDQISVSSDYGGSYITIFGVNPDRRGRGDIVVVLRGPAQTATVMRKQMRAGLWINGAPVEFSNTPSFFAVLSNRELSEIASTQSIWRYQLDPAAAAQLASAVPEGGDPSLYRAALVRLRRAQGLYQEYAGAASPEERGGLTMYQGGLFRAVVRLPANAPIANYSADTYLFRDGQLISSQRVPVRIERVGIERRIHDLAHGASFLYGLLVVLVALGAGWVAATWFRRS
jgi:hypothetical protein